MARKPHIVTFPDPIPPEFRDHQLCVSIAEDLEDIAPDEELEALVPVIYDADDAGA